MSSTPAAPKPTRRPRLTPHFKIHHTGEYFLRGILVVAPMVITLSFVYWIFNKLDGLLHPYVVPPGAGFLMLLFIILLIGWMSTFYVAKRTFRLIGHGIELTPGIS